jgi:hypothetical protein
MIPGLALGNIGEAVDRLITVPMSNWAILKGIPVVQMYEACRAKAGEPLTMAAARKLAERIAPGDAVIFATGFVILSCGKPETDGPVGAAALARAVDIGLKGVPLFVTEESVVGTMAVTAAAAGLHPWEPATVRNGAHRAVLEGFPIDDATAREASQRMLDRYKPAALIAIERPGWNKNHVYHSGGGFGISQFTAKIDYLFEEAKARGIFTLGIGDLGNELGMGYIRDTVCELVPHGRVCQCPCGGGIAADFEPDLGMMSNISNWGAYGVAACLAALLDEPEVLHDGETERRIIEECVRGGAIDPVSGMSRPYVDGTPTKTSVQIVELLNDIVHHRVPGSIFTREYVSAWKGKDNDQSEAKS